MHLSGSALGSQFPDLTLPAFLSQDILTRISGISIGTIHVLGPRFRWYMLAGIFILATLGGQEETTRRTVRQSIRVPDPLGPAVVVEHTGTGVVRITSWASPDTAGKWKATAVLLAWHEPGGESNPGGPSTGSGLLLTGEGATPAPGSVISGLFTLKVPRAGDLPGSFDYREYLAGRHLTWLATAEGGRLTCEESPHVPRLLGRARQFLLDRLTILFPRREAELAGAVLLGARTPGSRAGALPFAQLGLAHLFAVSGLHVGILLGLVILPGKALGFPPAARFLVVILFLTMYALLTGMPGSVVRAAGLGLFAAGTGAMGRRATPLHLLGLLFWATTVFDPVQVLDTGVRLSYLAAGGILVLVPLLKTGWSANRLASGLSTALAVSLAAQWFTLPQVAVSFGRFSLLAPLANIIAVPLFGLGIWAVVLAVILHLICPWAGEALAAAGWLLLRSLTGLAALVSSWNGGLNVGTAPTNLVTGSSWAILTAGLILSLRHFSSAPRKALLTCCGVLILGHGIFALSGALLVQGHHLKVWQFDVGQGDCSLVVFPDGWKCLIDTGGVFGFRKEPPDGPLSRSILPFLKRGWVQRVDAVVLSHGHLDHTGGVQVLEQDGDVRRWLVGGNAGEGLGPQVTRSKVKEIHERQTVHQLGPWRLEVIYPSTDLPVDLLENDRSLVLILSHKNQAVMAWSGDLETEGEAILLGQDLLPSKVQVWKAGHHGSSTSGSRAWLDRLDPDLVLISCGAGNKYGHPNHGYYLAKGDTLDSIRTDLEGTIQLEWDSRGALRWKTRKRKGHLTPLVDRSKPPP